MASHSPSQRVSSDEPKASEIVPTGTPVSGSLPPLPWWQKIALVFFGTVVGLVVIELGFRIFSHEFPTVPARKDRPHWYFYPVGTESMRDFRYTYAKPPGAYRISIVGDSFTFGTALHFDDTFSKRLERILNLNPSGTKVEVLNSGIPGYSSLQEERLVKHALQRDSDLVIVEVTLNDPEMQPFHVTHPGFDLQGKVQLASPIFEYWKSLAFVWQRLLNSYSHKIYRDYYYSLYSNPETWSGFRNAFEGIKRITAEKNARLAVVVFPLFSYPLDESYPFAELHRRINHMLDEQQIPHLDLLKAYAHIPADRLQIIPGDDSHPNEIAHRIAAEKIYIWLERSGILPKELWIKNKSRDRYGVPNRLLRDELLDKEP